MHFQDPFIEINLKDGQLMEIGLIEHISQWAKPYDTEELCVDVGCLERFCFIICFGAELWFI